MPNKCLENKIGLKSVIKDKRIVIIGNSDIETGRGRGMIIDDYDIVIRINNFSLAYQNDYGTKTDIVATSFHHEVREPNNKYKIVCPLPLNCKEVLNKSYTQTDFRILKKHIAYTEFIPLIFFHELTKIVPNPSTGIALIFWITKLTNIKYVSLYGFAFFKESIKHHYFDNYSACYHNGKRERQLISELGLKL